MHKFSILVLLLWSTVVAAEVVPELRLLDRMRTGEGSAKVTTRIIVEETGEPTRESRLDVYAHHDGRSLAVYRSDREAGQKVLLVDDQFWLFMPSSKRALRITPMQKLLGEASVGDVASLAWSEDYDVLERQVLGEHVVLHLEANRRGLSYQTIDLTVEGATGHPVTADFYLKSGKLAKQAEFDIVRKDGRWQLQGISLSDRVQSQQTTHILYDAIEPMSMPDKWFTPAFLLRSTP